MSRKIRATVPNNDFSNDKNYRRYISKEEHKVQKRNAILSESKEAVPARPVKIAPAMEAHIRIMQDKQTNRSTNGGSYPKKKYGRAPGTTKSNLSKRGNPVRTTYKYVLTKNARTAIKKYVKTIGTIQKMSDSTIEKLVKKAYTMGKPNTTFVVDRTFVHKNVNDKPVATGAIITFTSDMFVRAIDRSI